MENEKTQELINQLRDETNLYNYISKYNKDFPDISFPNYLELLIQKKGIKKSQMVKETGLLRTYAYQIISGKKKPSRNKVLQFALAMKLELEETQKLLETASFNPLYPKIKRESIIIFSICNHYSLDETNDLLYENKEEPID